MNRAAVPILILRAILGAAVCLSLSCDSPSGQGAQRKGATAAAPTPSVESAARPPVSSSSTGQLAQAVATDPEGPIIDWNYEGPSIGIRSAGPTYHVTAEFAIEEWDNGKAPEALQRWTLLCSYPQTRERPATECTLTRLMVTGLPKVGERPTRGFLGMVFYPAVSTNDHSTADGTLRIDDVDWPRGKLAHHRLRGPEASSAMLRWKYSGDLMYLESFTGGYVDTDASGKRTAVEFRIPEYTSVADVPIRLKGWRTARLKEWDSLVSGLDSADRVTWERIKSDPKNRPNFEMIDEIKAAFPEWEAIDSGKHTMSADEEKRLEQLMKAGVVRAMERWLATTALSAQARARILIYFRERNPS